MEKKYLLCLGKLSSYEHMCNNTGLIYLSFFYIHKNWDRKMQQTIINQLFSSSFFYFFDKLKIHTLLQLRDPMEMKKYTNVLSCLHFKNFTHCDFRIYFSQLFTSIWGRLDAMVPLSKQQIVFDIYSGALQCEGYRWNFLVLCHIWCLSL